MTWLMLQMVNGCIKINLFLLKHPQHAPNDDAIKECERDLAKWRRRKERLLNGSKT